MAKTYHCWRCDMPVPMLTKQEWKEVGPLLRLDTERTKELRKEKGIGLKEALEELQSEACEKYYELTGFKETNWQAIWHHRLSEHGPECPSCGHLFRTPKASFCANCGYKK
ncbi:hypothetical protein [Pelagicoccus sp. SDUM812002]|uniref:hypothetical protein n=1 Tax=Pelagicoccus sp. SDUM812002 TaxID=3041266 RepID=UPI00280F79F8|nr:hypothetical protein [Pelagicoccus sp. SDUM812002]MDQ8188570.1 hypothetical protein [Pelagicoccus sp. SDUM812002]